MRRRVVAGARSEAESGIAGGGGRLGLRRWRGHGDPGEPLAAAAAREGE